MPGLTRAAATFASAAALLLCGCATLNPPLRLAEAMPSPRPVLLEQVPFFPQDEYQCGPAALATVLVDSGVRTSPGALLPQVYLPGREGSLQLELIAATRRGGRIPYVVEPTPEALLAELQAGRPVLVLQNLLVRTVPRWHYAVLVGADPARNRLILNSGTERGLAVPAPKFLRTWDWAGRWGLVSWSPASCRHAPIRWPTWPRSPTSRRSPAPPSPRPPTGPRCSAGRGSRRCISHWATRPTPPATCARRRAATARACATRRPTRCWATTMRACSVSLAVARPPRRRWRPLALQPTIAGMTNWPRLPPRSRKRGIAAAAAPSSKPGSSDASRGRYMMATFRRPRPRCHPAGGLRHRVRRSDQAFDIARGRGWRRCCKGSGADGRLLSADRNRG